MQAKNGGKPPSHDSGPYTGRALLVVNTGSLKKKFILQKMKRLGLTVVVLNKEKNWAEPYVDHWIIADNTNHAQAIQAVKQFMSKHPKLRIEGAVTFWEDDVLLTSKIVEKFNFTGIPYQIAKNVRNKYLFREFCREHALPAPKHRLIRDKRDLQTILKEFSFPVVIKPAYGASSALVTRVNKKEELLDTYASIQEIIDTRIEIETALLDGQEIFIEEYIDGDEVDVDIILQNGKIKFWSISDNFDKTKDIFFIDRGQSVPSSLPITAQKALVDMVEEILEKLGMQNGCLHFEGKWTKNGPMPIELNMRMGGDYIYSYTRDAWGVDLIELVVKIALGEYIKPLEITKPKKYMIGWDLHPEYSGILGELTLDEKLNELPFVEEVHIDKEIGDEVLIPPEGYSYLGWLTVSGDNFLDAQDNLRAALEHIRYNVVPFDKESALGKTARSHRRSSAVMADNQMLVGATKRSKFWLLPPADQRRLHIGILGNVYEGKKLTTAQKRRTRAVYDIIKTLDELGYRVSFYNANNVTRTVSTLHESRADIIFNLCESMHFTEELSPAAASLLELFQLPYIGSNAFVRSLVQNKIATRKLLSFHKIPMPRWDYVYDPDDVISDDLEYPLILKTATLSDHGTDLDCIVRTPKEFAKKKKELMKNVRGPIIAEEFIRGQEYDVFIMGNSEENFRVLPLIKTVGPHRRNGSKGNAPSMKEKLQALVTEIALDTYNRLDCFDYGRVKIIVDKDGNPYVISVDTHPFLDTPSSFVKAASLSGIAYGDLIEQIIHIAVERYKKSKTVISLANNRE